MHLISASRGFRVCTKALEVRNERRKLLEAAWACLGGGCDRPVSVLATVPFLSFSVHFLKFAHCGSCSAYEGKGKEEAGTAQQVRDGTEGIQLFYFQAAPAFQCSSLLATNSS